MRVSQCCGCDPAAEASQAGSAVELSGEAEQRRTPRRGGLTQEASPRRSMSTNTLRMVHPGYGGTRRRRHAFCQTAQDVGRGSQDERLLA